MLQVWRVSGSLSIMETLLIDLSVLYEFFAVGISSSLSKWASYRGVQKVGLNQDICYLILKLVQVNFKTPELPDLGHELFPLSNNAPFVADVVATCLLLSIVYLATRARSISCFVQTFCGFHATLLLMRISLVVSTVLPSPVPECRDETQYATCPACQDIYDVFPSFSTWYCNDLMFSGHTMTNVLCWSFWMQSPVKLYTKGFITVLSLAGIVALLHGRQHYTADVLVAVYLTTLLVWANASKVSSMWLKSVKK